MMSRETIDQIRGLRTKRAFLMKAMTRHENATGAFVRSALGWVPDMAEADAAKLAKAAAKIVSAIRHGKILPGFETVIADVQGVVLAGIEGLKPLAKQRAAYEREMADLAQSLPVSPWVASIRGFGYFGLSLIVGECGDLSDYGNPGKIWRRLGLDVWSDGRANRRVSGDEALLRRYSPKRRSMMWTIGDSLMKCNRGGEYKTLYDERKAYEQARAPEMTKMHAHRRAQRYVEKRLLRDLWQAWREAIADLAPKNHVPPADYCWPKAAE